MHETVKEVYAAANRFFNEAYPRMQKLHDDIARCSDLQELADYAYALREVSRLVDDVRKQCDKHKELAEKICCAISVKDEHVGTIHTDYCRATPVIKMMAQLPNRNRDPEAYKTILAYFGLNPQAIEDDVARPHWPSLMEHISKLCEDGKPLPPGLDAEKTYPVYKLSPIVGKKERSILS